MNVLFVDDQKCVLDGIAVGVHFDELGIDQVYYATGADRAAEIMEEIPIDILMCDIEMPGEDGLSLIRRCMPKYPNMLTIMLTSHAEFEYAQESVRLGCFDYIIQPAPYEQIENVLRRALQKCYEKQKKNRLYEVGKRLQTDRMELLDKVTMNLFSEQEEAIDSGLEMLNVMGYSVTREKKARLFILSMDQFRMTENPIDVEKEIHKHINQALKDAEISYPMITLSAVAPHRRVALLVYSALQMEPELTDEDCSQFFSHFCRSMPSEAISLAVSDPTPMGKLRPEYLRLRYSAGQKEIREGILFLKYDPDNSEESSSSYIAGRSQRWQTLLAAEQYGVLENEFDRVLQGIERKASRRNSAMCDLHQSITQMFFYYFYDNHVDFHDLFQDRYSYYDYMNSYADPTSLRNGMKYMLDMVRSLKHTQSDISDVDRAKAFILENIADPITVKEVAEHVCLSAEYFTKLFKKETGQNIKEYITLEKIQVAKDMLKSSGLSVGMVAIELGYNNFSHFSQVFKKYEGMTPSEYRAQVTGNGEN